MYWLFAYNNYMMSVYLYHYILLCELEKTLETKQRFVKEKI